MVLVYWSTFLVHFTMLVLICLEQPKMLCILVRWDHLSPNKWSLQNWSWYIFLQVVVVDLDNNRVEFLPEDIPALPEVEGRQLRESLLQLAHPALVRLDLVHSTNSYLRRFSKPWCQDHDAELRYVQLIMLLSLCSPSGIWEFMLLWLVSIKVKFRGFSRSHAS